MASTVKNKTAVVTLIVNGKSGEANIKDFGAALKSVNKELRSMNANDPNFAKRLEEKRMITKEYLKQKAAIGDVRTGWQRFMAASGKIGVGVIAAQMYQMALGAIIPVFAKLIGLSGKLSDELANIAKTTNLSTEQVKELNEELSHIDTRTSMEGLRKLAEEAGRLGYSSKEDVLEFVKAADMINVALGDSLGEGAVKDIAKLTDIFKLKEIYGVEGAMLRVGSAINDIGMASTANEGYIVDFLKRMSGISGIANVSVQELIALGGTLDSLGQTSEVSSTALNKLLVKMGSDVKTYAKMAGVSMADFRRVMDKSAVEGLMLVLKQVGKTTGGIEQLSATLGDLGLDGGRVVGVLGTLAKNTDEYSRQLGISTSAMEKNTSITNEFNIKNENTQAILDKISKKFAGMWENASAGMTPFIQSFGKLVGVVSEIDLQLAELEEQQRRVTQAESKFPALLKQYDKLKSKSKLGADEQKELQKIVNEITKEVPGAATSFDKYGNALDLNRDKVSKFILEQRGLLETMRQVRRDLLKEELKDIEAKAKVLQYELNLGKKYSLNSGGQTITTGLTRDEINAKRLEQTRLKAEAERRRADLDAINGIVPKVKKPGGPVGETPEEKKIREKKEQDQHDASIHLSKEEAKRILEDRKRLHQDLLKEEQAETLSLMEEQEKQLQAIHYKYDEYRKRAKGNAEDLKRINADEVQALSNKNAEYTEKYLKGMDKVVRAQLDIMNKASAEKNDYDQHIFDEEAKNRDKELFEISNHYAKEIALARSKNMSIVALEAERDAAIKKLSSERKLKSNDDKLDLISNTFQSEMALAEMEHTSKVQVITSHLEELRKVKENFANLDIEQQKKVNRAIAQGEQDLLQERLQGYDRVGTALKAGGEAIAGILSLTAQNQAEYAQFQQALSLFTIAVDAGVAIAGAIAAATDGDGYTLVLRIAAAIAAVTSGIAQAKKMSEAAKMPSTPAFGSGGYSDSEELNRRTGGYFGRATLFQGNGRKYIAGEAGKEFIVSNMALQNPRVAAFTDMLDSVQKTQNWGRLNSLNPGSSTSTGSRTEKGMTDERIVMALNENNRLLAIVASKPGGINYRALEEYEDQLSSIRARASA